METLEPPSVFSLVRRLIPSWFEEILYASFFIYDLHRPSLLNGGLILSSTLPKLGPDFLEQKIAFSWFLQGNYSSCVRLRSLAVLSLLNLPSLEYRQDWDVKPAMDICLSVKMSETDGPILSLLRWKSSALKPSFDPLYFKKVL